MLAAPLLNVVTAEVPDCAQATPRRGDGFQFELNKLAADLENGIGAVANAVLRALQVEQVD
jgi:hypothetical protein